MISGTQDIAYGANGDFNYLYNQTSNVTCNNSNFGDPIPGTVKHCFVKESETTTPPSSGSCSGTKVVNWSSKTEISIAETNCIQFDRDLSNETLQAWDSDANNSCDFRGEITSLSNTSVSETITKNYQAASNLTGSLFKISPNNNCQYIKVRAY